MTTTRPTPNDWAADVTAWIATEPPLDELRALWREYCDAPNFPIRIQRTLGRAIQRAKAAQ